MKYFYKNNDGNVAMIFALCLPIIIGMVAVGIDFARASSMKSKLYQIVDSISSHTNNIPISCGGHAPRNRQNISSCLIGEGKNITVYSYVASETQKQFNQSGYGAKIIINPLILFNFITGRVSYQATTKYKCGLFEVLMPNCSMSITASSENAGISAHNNGTAILFDKEVYEIWMGETKSPGLPITPTTVGINTPYKFSAGPNLPYGVKINADTGIISGKPDPATCVNPCAPELKRVAISVEGESKTNIKNIASTNIAIKIIHPLKLSITPGKINNPLFTIEQSGGRGPFKFFCANLPIGLTCNPNNGGIEGYAKPNQSGTITVTVADSRGKTASAEMKYNSSDLK